MISLLLESHRCLNGDQWLTLSNQTFKPKHNSVEDLCLFASVRFHPIFLRPYLPRITWRRILPSALYLSIDPSGLHGQRQLRSSQTSRRLLLTGRGL